MADQNIYLIIDGSGSMSGVKHDVVKGINEFIKEQQDDVAATGDDVLFSLTTFDNNVMEVYSAEDLNLVNPVTLQQTYLGGGTALLDAIGRTLTNAEDVAAPRNIVVIYTDGHENQSHEFTHDQIAKLIEKLEGTGAWQFIYLGAEFGDFQKDAAFGTLRAAGKRHSHSINTSKDNVSGTFAAVATASNYLRGASTEDYNAVADDKLFSPLTLSKMGVDLSDVEVAPTNVTEPKTTKSTTRRTTKQGK